jgi:Fe2+ or Zn2+ uptake regulation protein
MPGGAVSGKGRRRCMSIPAATETAPDAGAKDSTRVSKPRPRSIVSPRPAYWRITLIPGCTVRARNALTRWFLTHLLVSDRDNDLTHSRNGESLGSMVPVSETMLRDAGLRVTRPRVAVLDALAEHPHATADVVARAVRRRLSKVSTQAVYDVLAVCVDAGLVRRIEPAGSSARFERRTGDNHHHLVCRSCGRTTDVDCVVGARPCLTPNDDSGYALDEAEIVFWGLCPDCQRQPDLLSSDVRSST